MGVGGGNAATNLAIALIYEGGKVCFPRDLYYVKQKEVSRAGVFIDYVGLQVDQGLVGCCYMTLGISFAICYSVFVL